MTLPTNIPSTDLSLAVLEAMRDAADAEILPRWRSLAAHEIRTKSDPWDLVTDADVNAERMLTESLRALIDLPVVGEEATAAHPALVDVVGHEGSCWVVDPVDGTRNFVKGLETFACMVALVTDGRTQAAWITYPSTGREMHAFRGGAAFLDGELLVAPTPRAGAPLRGAIGARLHLGPGSKVIERAAQLGPATPIRYCAGWDYLDVVTGETDYVSFSRSLPWDHAPGSLICLEAGLDSQRHDGTEYLPGDGRDGILTAHPSVWQRVADTLGPMPPAA